MTSPNMFSVATRVAQFQQKIRAFPFLSRYLAFSLDKRLETNDWHENRIVRYILKDSSWVSDLESTFQEAQLDTVPNSAEIFSVLQGTAADYDEQLFDALAEVRLCRWARQDGFASIEKLAKQSGHRTPELLMKKEARVTLAEAKHFRVRDYLLDFVTDRLEGLALKTGGLREFGLRVESGRGYAQMRDSILMKRQGWIEKARDQLTEGALSSLEQSVKQSPHASFEIMDGLFAVEHSGTASAGRVFPTVTHWQDPKATAELCLSKLEGELLNKLQQIKGFMETTGAHADHAVVFFSGISQSEPEWDVLWSALGGGQDQWVWERVKSVHAAARAVSDMPFDLIVGRYTEQGRGPGGVIRYEPIEYSPFPWNPKEM